MRRRPFLQIALAPPRNNFVFVHVDDLRFDELVSRRLGSLRLGHDLVRFPHRPHLVGDPCTTGRIQLRLDGFLNLAAFTRPAPDTCGSSARTLNTRTPGIRSMDIAALKNFNLSEKRYFPFRAKAFHRLNHPVFSAPNSNVGDSNFGVITGVDFGARQMPLPLKFYS